MSETKEKVKKNEGEKKKKPKSDDAIAVADVDAAKPKADAVAPDVIDTPKKAPSDKKSDEEDAEDSNESSKVDTKPTKSKSSSSDSGATVKKARSKKKSRHHMSSQDAGKLTHSMSLLQKKEKDDLDERKELEKNLSRLTQQLAALQERMYSIRFDDSVEPNSKIFELRNFANQVLFCERQIALAYRESIEVFEDQLALHEINLDGVLDPIHASEVSDTELHRTGSFMRTPSTQSVQSQEPRKKWQSAFKMIKEKKDQTAVAQGQYVTSRDSSMKDLDEEISKLRNAVIALRGRKNLNPRDERTLELMQEQLKVRVQQKERYARQLLGSAQ